jgi:hypothetical protein
MLIAKDLDVEYVFHISLDIIKNEIIDIYEIPLIIMEGTLKEYRNLTQNKALK